LRLLSVKRHFSEVILKKSDISLIVGRALVATALIASVVAATFAFLEGLGYDAESVAPAIRTGAVVATVLVMSATFVRSVNRGN
jgi:hypothetical protein